MNPYDPSIYRHSIVPQIKLWMDNRPNSTPLKELNNLAIVTSCPLIVLVKLFQEVYGESEELSKQEKRLERFYGVI